MSPSHTFCVKVFLIGTHFQNQSPRTASFSIPPSLHLRHSSFSNLSVASPTSQLILQTFRRFIYVTAHSSTLQSLYLRHRHFTYIIWRAAHSIYGPLHPHPRGPSCPVMGIPLPLSFLYEGSWLEDKTRRPIKVL